MKRFEDILGMSQKSLKDYLCSFLCGIGYSITTGDGYVFAKGDVPVLLIAHMDTVKGEIPKTIIKEPTLEGIRMIAENSLIGGDDRCGVWMIMNIIKKVKCHVLFLEDEEIGCVGARKFTKTNNIDYVKENISFMIELDRRGSNDCVYYSNDNRDFVKYIEEKTGTKEAYGSMSDISTLMPATNVAGVNISCGYYKEHTHDEYIMLDEMNDIMQRLMNFLTSETEFPRYKYVAKYRQMSFSDYKFSDYRFSGYDYYGYKSLSKKAMRSLNELCLTVTLDSDMFDEGEDIEREACGKTQAECWANLFMENEELSFSMITDFFYS